MQDFQILVEKIRTKEDFLFFIKALIIDFNTDSENWENYDLRNYLEAIESVTEDLEGFYLNKKIPVPDNINWKVFAEILISAKYYE